MIFDVNESDSDLSSLDGDEFSDWDETDYGSEYGSDLDFDSEDEREIEAALRDDIRWDVGQVIRVKFMGGGETIRNKVKYYASIWMKYANIKFKFVPDNAASDVRISFIKNKGCHSKVGKYALKVPPSKPTMNLGFTSRPAEYEIRRAVLHEFGHVLGCSHEHSSPNANIPWNKRAVYPYFWDKNKWDEAETYRNVLAVKHESSIASEFDPKSIMMYEIPREITRGGFSVPLNTHLSEIDKRVIAEQYPKPVKCFRCRNNIKPSYDLHCYCENHCNYICEDCYDSPRTWSQVRDGYCRYRVYNDTYKEFEKCNRCYIGLRITRDVSFYCTRHENYLCEDCYNTSSTRRQVRSGSCWYEDDEDNYYYDGEDNHYYDYDEEEEEDRYFGSDLDLGYGYSW